jgi:multiple antibiotic resistance protein
MSIGYFFEVVFLAVGGLLPIMNPFSTAPLFASLTDTLDGATRQRQARKGCLYAFPTS